MDIRLLVLALCFAALQLQAQDTLRLTLREAIGMAQEHSPEAIASRHSFRASYWNWRSFKANLLPSLTFTSNPYLNRSISTVTNPDGTDNFVHRNQLSVDGGLTINQNIPFTGGSLYVNTALQRLDMFENDITSYKSSPIVIGYEQNLFGYNTLKWDKKIEPVRYEEAKKTLVEALELVAARTTLKFFQLASAQTNWEIALFNHANADTLYQFAQGRYNIGTITENEMLQLEINLLTEQTNMMNARIEMDDYIQELRSYLGINENVYLFVDVEEAVPAFSVPIDRALVSAYENNPQLETLQRRKLESESAVALAKAERGFRADLYVQFGLTQSDEKLKKSYRDPMDQQQVSIGIRIPIVDWGVGKGKVQVAVSNRDKVYTEVAQEQTDFELNVLKLVKQFNLQTDKVRIAKKTDQTARRRNEVAQRLYLLGKSDILDLKASITEKDTARRAYITALYNYWNLYYGVRSLTGYDFEKNKSITETTWINR
ncbi:outer membrane protein TolC [Parabacteroides sp. PF5-5]|uniref:TolC family protein n=1 Tax=unclassified Parabacteroides TaxID=2649774 RepID=UPI0024730906|nr:MULTISPECIES: TolC family protein [unclassified Parabacteroides]MDH6303500.1 outer membrane protein TolC [Parabacteroides sp. PH5-39]MDH6314822.1 outer membrane protein TolC [Parabacteroides sp. PF5-13]MDH6318159.1 outer membrane protein TolC [Parabacteroides sp. PH5-13]MDH6321909.1 outer membrane protein TolC [Parabacteroides sp. PH5-8]MDH6326033.1 outer membrane protein TolC [Parabacteroides sp. PH5-41]